MKYTDIPIVIMAGGIGSRMRPFSDVLPKPLLLFDGKTMIENVINNFSKLGFRIFYFVLYFKSELIKAYIDSLSLPIEIYYVYESEPLGTAGGLYYLKGMINSNFILCNCDNFGAFDYLQGIDSHIAADADITIFVKRQRHEIPFGIIHINEDKIVSKIDEKPSLDFYASTGVHIINERVLQTLSENTVIDMPKVINTVAKNGKVITYDVGDSIWIDMSITL